MRKLNIRNSPYVDVINVVADRSNSSLPFISLIGYDNAIKIIAKEINKKNQIYVEGLGHYNSTYKMYDIYKTKDQNSDYSHLVLCKKDEITKNSNGEEILNMYIFVKNYKERFNIYEMAEGTRSIPETFLDILYNKLYKNTPVPILKEWMPFIFKSLVNLRAVYEKNSFPSFENDHLKAIQIVVSFSRLFTIVSNGLADGSIYIRQENREPSESIMQVTGLDSYLECYSEILARKIQESFTPKFIPGEDSFSDKLLIFKDYADNHGISMYDAQMCIAQSVSNHLDKNKVGFIIGEMGSGKTCLAIASIFTNIKRLGTTNIIMCPAHLLSKWKKEIDRLMPLSKSIIVNDFNHFKSLETMIKDKKRKKHLFLIMSKEIAKFGYEKRPSVKWSLSNKYYICPECGRRLFKEEWEGVGREKTKIRVPLTELDFSKEYVYNKVCMYEDCSNKLWTPLIKEDDSEWMKLPKSQGWIEKKHINSMIEKLTLSDKLTRKETNLLSSLMDARLMIESDSVVIRAPRKFPISKYIKEHLKNQIDYFVCDEMHQYKGGNSEQGQAFGDLVVASKKVIGLTGTLLNGYANGLFYLIYKTMPQLMQKEGFDYSDEMEFSRQYGVIKKVSNVTLENGREVRRLNSNEKILPGVSPLVFTKFLLSNSAFISLSDIADGLPSYQEIPVGVDMPEDLALQYENIKTSVRTISGRRGMNKKTMSSLYQLLSVYPDMPYNQPPILHPDTGDILFIPTNLNQNIERSKETELLRIIQEKITAGEKVLVYYHWTNRTDIGERLPEMLSRNNIRVLNLESNSVKAKDREDWIKERADSIDVLLCNPTLVETGLDLLDFTTIIFYQVGFNIFTMRQASRRSWRLSQDKDIEVYFLYYRDTVQESALSLMATKLQASQAIEGKFSEEGLHAMSNNEDLLSQIANSVVNGIKHSIDVDVFNNMSHKKTAKEIIQKEKIVSRINISEKPLNIYSGQIRKRIAKKIKKQDNPIINGSVHIGNLL